MSNFPNFKNFQMAQARNNSYGGGAQQGPPKLFKEIMRLPDPSTIEVGVSHRNNSTEPYLYLRNQDGRMFISMNQTEVADLIDVLDKFGFPSMNECHIMLKQAEAQGLLTLNKKVPVRSSQPSKYHLQLIAEREAEIERLETQQHRQQLHHDQRREMPMDQS